jgi:uncharacterized membrane protein
MSYIIIIIRNTSGCHALNIPEMMQSKIDFNLNATNFSRHSLYSFALIRKVIPEMMQTKIDFNPLYTLCSLG